MTCLYYTLSTFTLNGIIRIYILSQNKNAYLTNI